MVAVNYRVFQVIGNQKYERNQHWSLSSSCWFSSLDLSHHIFGVKLSTTWAQVGAYVDESLVSVLSAIIRKSVPDSEMYHSNFLVHPCHPLTSVSPKGRLLGRVKISFAAQYCNKMRIARAKSVLDTGLRF